MTGSPFLYMTYSSGIRSHVLVIVRIKTVCFCIIADKTGPDSLQWFFLYILMRGIELLQFLISVGKALDVFFKLESFSGFLNFCNPPDFTVLLQCYDPCMYPPDYCVIISSIVICCPTVFSPASFSFSRSKYFFRVCCRTVLYAPFPFLSNVSRNRCSLEASSG